MYMMLVRLFCPTQLVELLGIGEIEMIQELLAHREAIVASVLQDSSSLLHSSKKIKS